MAIIVGIDLHGTLINDREIICPEAYSELERVLKAKPAGIKLYICTGNDLPFIARKIGALYDYFDGAVLETGCVVSTEPECEKLLIPAQTALQIKKLEQELLTQNFPEVYKFARRLATISMFTRYDASLEEFFSKISALLQDNPYCRVTRSSVAVDLIPHHFDKFSGLAHFAEADDRTAAIADSLNDLELLKKADFALLPQNHHAQLPQLIGTDKCRIFKGEATFGVIEALKFLYTQV